MTALEWLTAFIVGLLWIEHYMGWRYKIAKLKVTCHHQQDSAPGTAAYTKLYITYVGDTTADETTLVCDAEGMTSDDEDDHDTSYPDIALDANKDFSFSCKGAQSIDTIHKCEIYLSGYCE